RAGPCPPTLAKRRPPGGSAPRLASKTPDRRPGPAHSSAPPTAGRAPGPPRSGWGTRLPAESLRATGFRRGCPTQGTSDLEELSPRYYRPHQGPSQGKANHKTAGSATGWLRTVSEGHTNWVTWGVHESPTGLWLWRARRGLRGRPP